MNETTKRFPRTLAEAFPDSREASIARAHYGCAVTRYREDFSHTRVYMPIICVCTLIGFIAGVLAAS